MILEDSTAFLQYAIFNEKQLVTIIGELHDQEHPNCSEPKISVGDFCVNVLNKNSTAKIFLEYNAKFGNPKRTGSKPINYIYNTLETKGGVDKILPFDIRSEFLTMKGQDILYNGNKFTTLSLDDIRKNYIESFFTKKLCVIHDISSPLGNYVDDYFQDLSVKFTEISDNIKLFTRDELREKLKFAWMLVTDYPILATICNPYKVTNEYIIVAGNMHRKNIEKFLDNIGEYVKKVFTGINTTDFCIDISGLKYELELF